MTRRSETQLRELQEMLSRYRAMLAAANPPAPGATRRSIATLRDRLPDAFKGLTEGYAELLETYLVELSARPEKPREIMARLAAGLGDAGAGPRDLFDMHLAARWSRCCPARTRSACAGSRSKAACSRTR